MSMNKEAELAEEIRRLVRNSTFATNINVPDKILIKNFRRNVHWHVISQYDDLSEIFIEGFHDKVNWLFISIGSSLSEEFMEKWQNKISWNQVSLNQRMSGSFIEKFKDKLFFSFLSRNKRIRISRQYLTHLYETGQDSLYFALRKKVGIKDYYKLVEGQVKKLFIEFEI